MIDEKLAKAFARLQIESDSNADQAKERFRDLVAVWHPDKHQGEKQKRKAENEMKLINSAWDIVKAHYQSNHKDDEPCSCRDQQTSKGPNKPEPGPPKGPTAAEREAERRSKERAEQAAKEAKQAADKTAAEANAAEAARQKAAEQPFDPERVAADEKLRWRIAACMGIAWLILTGFAFTATTLKGWWTDFSDKWQRDHPPAQQQTVVPPAPPGPTPEELAQKARDDEAARQKQQDIDSTKKDIERYNGYLGKSNRLLANANSLIEDPTIAESEKIKFRADVRIQTDFIAKTQADLKVAQDRLADLTGQPTNDVPAPPVVDLSKLQSQPVVPQKMPQPTGTDFLHIFPTPVKKENAWDQVIRDQDKAKSSP